MAIVEMKRLTLLGLHRDKARVFRELQRLGCVEIAEQSGEAFAAYTAHADAAAKRLETVSGLLPRVEWLISQLNRYHPMKNPFMGARPEADPAAVQAIEADEAGMTALIDQAEALERRLGDSRGRISRLQAQMEQYASWAGLDIPAEELHSLRHVAQLIGTVGKRALEGLERAWADLPVAVETVGEQREQANVWIACHLSCRDRVLADLRAADWTPVTLPCEKGTVADWLKAQQDAVRAELRGQLALQDEWRALAERLPDVRVWYDLLQVERDGLAAQGRTLDTASAFLAEGWVPADAAQAVTERLEKIAPACQIEITDPPEGVEPPVLLQNGRAAAPFEAIVSGYALPRYGTVDPTAAMAPFYAFLFGMMLSDAGYGLVMALAIPLLIRVKHPAKENQKMLWVIFWSSLATVVCGAIYNTWFGAQLLPVTLLDPIGNPMPVMIFCLAVGLLHLYAGLGVGAYANIRKGKVLDAVFDQFSWILAVSGVIMLLAGDMIAPGVAEAGKWLAIAGVAIIVLFAGREKKNPFSRLLGGLGALYGATSWISDIFSYMRLFGMGLATGVIGMVINMLIGMMMEAGPLGIVFGVVIAVFAHLFNLGINALGAYVHSCRLQYIEFFGKFYEEGGVPFRPLKAITRYVNLPEEKAA